MLALLNGIIHTLDPTRPRASAILIQEDRIVSLGDDPEILPSADPSAEKIDLQGRTVVPGFVDAHVHLLNLGLSLRSVNLDGVPSIRRCVDRVKNQVDRASFQSWVTGLGWNYTIWEEARFPHRTDLDEISPSHPVVLTSKNGHQAWCNSAALRLADIRKNTSDPPGGRIEREPDGEPTGVLSEEAIQLVTRHVPDPTPDCLLEAYLDAQRMANARGLTGFHDCDAHGYDGIAMREMLEGLHRNDRLTLRAVLMIPDDRIDEAIARGWRTGEGNSHVRVGPVKVFADGALGPRTADMLDPYEGEPQNRGMVVTEEGRLFDLTAKAHGNGLQLAVHAIGDRAVRRCLDAFERSLRTTPGDFRPRIEHVQVVDPEDLDRFRPLGVVASMQPIHAPSDMEMADRFWGPRVRSSYAWRSLLDAGAEVAFGSDCPVEPLDPLFGLYAAVTRKRGDGTPPGGWTPEQCITISEALHAYTHGSAYASGQEAHLGTLAPGKLADLVVLSHDILSIPSDEIPDVKVFMTMVGGRTVFQAEE